jgi:hypothetical protein
MELDPENERVLAAWRLVRAIAQGAGSSSHGWVNNVRRGLIQNAICAPGRSGGCSLTCNR